MINSMYTQNIHHCSHKDNGGRRLSSGTHVYGGEYGSHVKPQESKPEIRQGKLKHISSYVAIALQEVMRDEH